ncbi:TonB-dependent siderophore receptor [Chitinophaga sp. SYP-B3965]|nr:TonB-dependent siderophore receptor [Chitinophaga sp. SYP-B3965]
MLPATFRAAAQQPDPQITVSRHQLTVKQIIEEVQKQTSYSFTWSSRYSDVQKTVFLTSLTIGLEALLQEMSKQAGLRFVRTGDQIVVRTSAVTKDRPTQRDEDDDIRQLQEFEVSTYRNRFARSGSEYVAKLPLKKMENPQVYSTITADLLKEQMVMDFGYAMKNTPGLYKMQGSRGINTDGASVFILRGFRTEASLMDGMPAQTNGEIDPAHIARIEVLKGPSATLFGSSLTSFGGLINTITKKPLDHFGGELSYSTGSFQLNRLTADVYSPINRDSSLLLRINAAYQNQQSFQDAGFRKTVFVAPALSYQVNDRMQVEMNAEFYSSEATSSPSVFLNRTRPFLVHSPAELGYDWKRSYTANDLTMKTPTVNARARVTYRLSDNWTSQTLLSSNTRRSNGYYQYQFIRKATEDSLERNVVLMNTVNSAINVQQNFTGDFHIGRFRNRLVVGLDYLAIKAENDNSPYIVFDFVNALRNDDPNYVKISRTAVDARLAASTAAPTRTYSNTNTYSIYASDVINITDRLLAMLSLRVDRFEGLGTMNRATNSKLANSEYKQTALSPKFGIVYQVVKDQVSLFGNYMNGFANVTPVTQPLPDISGTFKPQQANQWEGGVKLSLFNNMLDLTASYYDITVTNMTRTEEITRDNTKYAITVQNGTQTSRGFELELIATPAPGLNIIAGYGYNDSKLIKAAKGVDNRRPPSAGPANLFNTWISYTLHAGKLKGLGAGIGGNYIGEHIFANNDATGLFILPSYTLVNATVFYDAPRYRLGLKIDNITDELYFAGQGVLTPQLPRNFAATVAVKF